jgi:hypothetical protein
LCENEPNGYAETQLYSPPNKSDQDSVHFFKLYRNAHLMRDIRVCEPAYLEVTGGECKFALAEYTDPTGGKLPEYPLTKSQCLFLTPDSMKMLVLSLPGSIIFNLINQESGTC